MEKQFQKQIRWGSADWEIEGLQALGQHVRVPKIYQTTEKSISMEWIATGSPNTESHRLLAQDLAKVHQHTHDQFGWHRDNAIGEFAQPNNWQSTAEDFYVNVRLDFQVESTRNSTIQMQYTQVKDRIKSLLQKVTEAPRLCHGDLWNGNILFDQNGYPVWIDPAIHFGCRESDIAMMKLFGGFAEAVFDEYQKILPLTDEQLARIPIFQLYHMLNHYNIFGGSYLNSVLELFHKIAR